MPPDDIKAVLARAVEFIDANVAARGVECRWMGNGEALFTLTYEDAAGDDAVSFDNMAGLSEILHTRLINFGSAFRESSGCESCGYGAYSAIDISCSGVIA